MPNDDWMPPRPGEAWMREEISAIESGQQTEKARQMFEKTLPYIPPLTTAAILGGSFVLRSTVRTDLIKEGCEPRTAGIAAWIVGAVPLILTGVASRVLLRVASAVAPDMYAEVSRYTTDKKNR